MNAAVFDQYGEPSEVLRYAEVPTPVPGPGQVLVRMIASPINPSDIMTIRGKYMVNLTLPATPGYEGVGVVESAGPGLLGSFMKGRRVAVLNQAGGNWAEYVVVKANRVVPVPKDLPDEQVASFFINPATALAMVRKVLQVPKGAWLLQSAAGSTLGKMIIKLGKHDGFKTLNVVRRHEAIDELKALGADAVISSSDGPIEDQVRKIVGVDGVKYAIDPVGGSTGSAIYDSLALDGRMLVYGTLSYEPLTLRTRSLIAGKRIEGFYLGHFMLGRSILKNIKMFREIGGLIREGVLESEPGESFPLDRIAEAVRASEVVGKKGKVLLTIGHRA
ncbi:zinc-dependent alcohol dehydrogenase family protein [Isosphaeraceae bacterium EP7]